MLALLWAAALTLVDLEMHRLPDALTLPAYPVVALLLTWCSPTIRHSALGDVKLAGVLDALLGWFSALAAVYGLVTGFLVGGLVAGALLILRRADRRSTIPLGPAMVAGAYLVALTLPVLVG